MMTIRVVRTLLLFSFVFILAISCHQSPSLIIYPAPEEISPSVDFKIKVNGRAVFVYPCRVSARPANQIWPGHQRPLEQTEMASFAYFDFSKPVVVEVESKQLIETVDIRPLSYVIKPVIMDHTITFPLDHPCQIVVEINGWHHALHLFANAMEAERPKENDPGVHYFGPGYHDMGKRVLKSDESLYIAGGAVVHGVIFAQDATDIKVYGRGILDARRVGRFDEDDMISFRGCRHVQLKGIIITDPHRYAVAPVKCRDVVISDIKLVGMWRYNSDGIHPMNCQNVSIGNCFVRGFDDNIVISAHSS